MKSTKPAVPKDALECKPGEVSACGLPSNVVIDMSKGPGEAHRRRMAEAAHARQYQVAREQGTEPAFQNEYWDNHADGVYFSVCSDTPLFDSRDKFDSGTGWPSFTKPIEKALVGETVDESYGMTPHRGAQHVDGRTSATCSTTGPRPTACATGIDYFVPAAAVLRHQRRRRRGHEAERGGIECSSAGRLDAGRRRTRGRGCAPSTLLCTSVRVMP